MEELSESQNKCMLTIGGKRLIEYSLDNASAIDEISEIVIVVGYRAESIINCYGTNYRGKRISYVIQPEQRGLVNAMECAADYIDRHDFLLFLFCQFKLTDNRLPCQPPYINLLSSGAFTNFFMYATNAVLKTLSIKPWKGRPISQW